MVTDSSGMMIDVHGGCRVVSYVWSQTRQHLTASSGMMSNDVKCGVYMKYSFMSVVV